MKILNLFAAVFLINTTLSASPLKVMARVLEPIEEETTQTNLSEEEFQIATPYEEDEHELSLNQNTSYLKNAAKFICNVAIASGIIYSIDYLSGGVISNYSAKINDCIREYFSMKAQTLSAKIHEGCLKISNAIGKFFNNTIASIEEQFKLAYNSTFENFNATELLNSIPKENLDTFIGSFRNFTDWLESCAQNATSIDNSTSLAPDTFIFAE